MAWANTYANGAAVETSKQTSSSILFAHSGYGTVIRQVETVETKEVRGLDESAAREKGGTISDSTAQHQAWAHIFGRTHSISYLTGSKTEYSAARRDESGQWVVTETKHTFSISPANLPTDWGTTELDADGNAVSLSSGGDAAISVSVEKTVSRLAWDVFQTLTTTVKEIRHVNTEANARSLVSANTPATQATPATVYYHSTLNGNDTVSSWVSYMNGTEKFASARRVSESEGWTVTVTEKVYGWSSPRAATDGNGWR